MSKSSIAAKTDNNGKNNEDAFFTGTCKDKTILCVCDGVGGTDAGEIASGYVVKNLEAWLKTRDISVMGAKSLHREISSFVEEMHADLQIISKEKGITLGTTFIFAVIGTGKAVIENVGDSRAYVCQRGYLKQITIDQTVRFYELAGGDPIDYVSERKKDSTLMQCIGSGLKDPDPASYSLALDEDVDILLCSDGLSNKLNELNFQSQLLNNPPEAAVDNLIDLAKKRGETDNITAVLFRRNAQDPR